MPSSESTPAAAPPAPVEVPASTSVVGREQAANISRFVLKNGMVVIISEQHASPLAAVAAFFRATPGRMGSDDRRLRQIVQQSVIAGGTTGRRPGQIFGDVRSLGGTITNEVSYSGDLFLTVAPAEKIKETLALQSDMLQHASLAAEAVNRAAQLVSMEDAGRLGDPPAHAIERVIDIALPSGPAETVRDASQSATVDTAANGHDQGAVNRDHVARYYQQYYTPSNLIVAIAGDVSTFDALVAVERLYSEFGAQRPIETAVAPAVENTQSQKAGPITRAAARNAGGAPAASPALATPDKYSAAGGSANGASTGQAQAGQSGPGPAPAGKLVYKEERGDLSQTIVTLGYPVFGSDAQDWPVMEVLAALIGQGRGSLLNRRLLLSQGLVSRVESQYAGLAGAGLLSVRIWTAPAAIDKAEAALFKEIDRLRREPLASSELQRAKTLAEKVLIDKQDTYAERAAEMAIAEASGPGLSLIAGQQHRIRAVTAEDVQRAAAKYLSLANTCVYEYEPYSAPARTFDSVSFAQTAAAWAPGLAQQIAVKEAEPVTGPKPAGTGKQPAGSSRAGAANSVQAWDERATMESMQPLPIKDFSILNGPRVYVREDHTRPKATIAILFEGGRVVEDDTNTGITELMLRSMLYGTAHRTPEQAAIQLDEFGAEVRLVAEPDCYGFVLSTLSEHAGRALRILRDLMDEPAFRDEDIEHARSEQIGAIRQARDDAAARSRELLFQATFPGSAYGLPPHGREETIAKLKSDALQAWYDRTVKLQFPLVVIVGDTAGSALASEGISEGFKRRETSPSLKVKVPRPEAGSEKSEQRRWGQTAVALESAGPKGDSADLPAVDLIEAIMSGPGGRLRTELTYKQGLALEPRMTIEAMLAGGLLGFYAETSPPAEARIRSALAAEIGRMATGTVTADELAQARATAAGNQMARLQSQQERALEYARAIFFKRAPSEIDSYPETLSKITAEDVKRAAQTYL
ncbi:MAG TPA: insulinase family protein, partial [Blastocatellia bacterium]|nr:insulinase family protein [Blastocatellia bacterium]